MATSRERAATCYDAIRTRWRGAPLSFEQGTGDTYRRLSLIAPPEYIRNLDREPTGIDALVRLYDRDGVELPVDPHRICINPPTVPKTGVTYNPDTRVRTVAPNPEVAYFEWLMGTLVATPNPVGFRTRGTVTTILGDLADNTVFCVSNVSYAQARAGTGTLAIQGASDPFGVIGQAAPEPLFTGQAFGCYEFFEAFDTSSIPDADTISATTLTLHGAGGGDGSVVDFTINCRLYDWGAAITTADYIAGASLSANTLLATFNTVSWSTAVPNVFTSDAAFIANVNKTGVTRVVLCSSRQEGNNTPGGNEYVGPLSTDGSGTLQDPSLEITHAAVFSGATFFTEQLGQMGPPQRPAKAVAY